MALRPTSRARSLRREMTSTENLAWQTLRRLREFGFPVRRQHPIAGFVVDFAIPKARLVIEIDGGIHRLASVAERDASRDRQLVEAGWEVLRISNEDASDADRLLTLVCGKLGL